MITALDKMKADFALKMRINNGEIRGIKSVEEDIYDYVYILRLYWQENKVDNRVGLMLPYTYHNVRSY